jgi:hypothetical protein
MSEETSEERRDFTLAELRLIKTFSKIQALSTGEDRRG